MTEHAIQQFLEYYGAYFDPNERVFIERTLRLSSGDLDAESLFYNPENVFSLSLLLGIFGIDRFVIGDCKRGLFKLATLGGLGVYAVYDLFQIKSAVRQKNIETYAWNVIDGFEKERLIN